jgi:hypothetical protein
MELKRKSTKVGYVLSAVILWFLSFFLTATYGKNEAFLIYSILGVINSALVASLSRFRIVFVFMFINLFCLVVPVQECFSILVHSVSKLNRPYLFKYIVALLMIGIPIIVFLFTTLKLGKNNYKLNW